ncbi:tRNA threonylcarbamoyladenosine modification (KEOPS) complex, Pcc1 subunit [Halobellus clavatus]|jgi:KEOPS complex subunit Pcc1|uniref:tRNA threonylcarbamoyladenosine modification (KEOPS) complex, Pcc1 subunit n=1 Tax=Halobellus clavatus TaxID=660517 RepID=A0A1H3CWZ0_9EURY|nr:tRNA threonylcarbamoyladenosine modification (KEOPS) complex, Pcc1 subunit [Halobellus clavatus]
MTAPESPADGDDVVHAAAIDFTYPTQRRARIVAESAGVEVGEIDDDRSGAELVHEDDRVSLDVEATDLVAVRAGLNTWLRLVDVAEAVADDAASRGPESVPAGDDACGDAPSSESATHGDEG